MTIGRSKEELETLGKRIRDLRTAKGMTQSELAEGFISSPMVSMIESGKCMPGTKVLLHLAERLGTTIDELLRDVVFYKMQMSAYKLALSQIAVKLYAPALNLLENLLEEKSGLHHEIALEELLLNLAICYRETGRYEDAVETLKRVTALYQGELQKQQNCHFLVDVYVQLSKTYLRMGNYFEALCEANHARDGYESMHTPDPLVHGQIVLHLAFIYMQTHRFDDARECYRLALDMYSNLDDDLDKLGLIYQRLAEVYYHQGNHPMTLEFANKALVSLQASSMISEYRDAKRVMIIQQVNEENWQDSVAVLLNLAAIHARNDHRKEAALYLDIADIYLKHDEAECFNYCVKAIFLLTRRKDESELLGKAQFLMGRLAQKRGQFEEARIAMEDAIRIFKKTVTLGALEQASRQLSSLFVQQGDPKKALENNESIQDFIADQLRERGIVL